MAHPPTLGFKSPKPPLAEVNVASTPQGKPEPRLFEQLRDAICVRHYSIRTREAYAQWVRSFVVFSKRRHPLDMVLGEVAAFLTHLAVDRDVGSSTQKQAKSPSVLPVLLLAAGLLRRSCLGIFLDSE